MPKKLLRRMVPDHETMKKHKNLQFLGNRLHEPNLWHLNRRSVSRAFAIGLFIAWFPGPGQMAMAAFLAFYRRANLPIAVALVWLSNPITMPPMFYFAYLLGLRLLRSPAPDDTFDFTLEGIINGLDDVWGPLLVGCFMLGSATSLVGYGGIRLVWRYAVAKRWQDRALNNMEK